ncbi:MAG: hypothetical protein ACFBZ9_01250 [Sphingomonadales bacterium]
MNSEGFQPHTAPVRVWPSRRCPDWLLTRLQTKYLRDPGLRERYETQWIGGKDTPYRERVILRRSPLTSLYLHEFHRSDDPRALHDHPWASVSILLRGALIEILGGDVRADRNGDLVRDTGARNLPVGSMVYRPAGLLHRLVVPQWLRPGESPVSLFLTGPRFRSWGFDCPQGWRHWRDFVDADDTGLIGRGCGEP